MEIEAMGNGDTRVRMRPASFADALKMAEFLGRIEPPTHRMQNLTIMRKPIGRGRGVMLTVFYHPLGDDHRPSTVRRHIEPLIDLFRDEKEDAETLKSP